MQERELYQGMAGHPFNSGDLSQQCDFVIDVSALCRGECKCVFLMPYSYASVHMEQIIHTGNFVLTAVML